MLGSAFVALHEKDELHQAGRAEIAASGVEGVIDRADPEVVINCAADTDVEAAESDGEAAWATNARLPGVIGDACRKRGALLVHLSSTGVYGDWKSGPYTENDPARPTTVHHRTKLAGEAAVVESGCEHLIVRTGWLFGGRPGAAKNFVWKRLVEAAGSESMTSDPFQRGCPTFTDDLVHQVQVAIGASLRGLINAVGEGEASRLDYVRRIVDASGLPCRVDASTAPFERLARVSPNEAALNQRLKENSVHAMRGWEEAIDAYVAQLLATPDWARLREAQA